MVERLIDRGPDMHAIKEHGRVAWFYAAFKENEEMMEKLNEWDVDINNANKHDTTALFNAACEKHLIMLARLLQCNVDFNAKDQDGETVLFYAVREENQKMVEKLIESGANINATDLDGRTALFHAIFKENQEMVEKLIECGTDINAKDQDGKTVLFYAVREQNKKMVEKLIECGADINASDRDGRTALFYSVFKENEKMVKTLIECGADVNATNNNGKTCLFYAVEDENMKMVEKLIECGADVNATDKYGVTASFYAAEKENEIIVETLIECGADINTTKTALLHAVWKENEKMVEKSINRGADINATNKDGKTALFYAVLNENRKVAEKLIERGADINATDEDGRTALFYAVEEENEKVIEKLIECGADINATDKHGKTTLFYTVEEENMKMIEKSIECGADVNATDQDGKTVLFYAVHEKSGKILQKLIESGADMNGTDKYGNTALFYAIQNDDAKMVEKLIACSANIHATFEDSKTALIYAVTKENKQIVEKLIECGADINATDQDGKTALFYAIENDNENIVEILIGRGADISAMDKNCRTPLFYAVGTKNEKMAETLIGYGVDINAADKNGRTALFYAVEKLVPKLIDCGDDGNQTDNEKKTALFYVNSDYKRWLMARTLIEDGAAQVNVRDRYDRTPLFYAMTQSLSLARYLLDKGAILLLNANCSALTFFIEKCFFSLQEKTPNLQEGLNLLTESKELERKTVLEAIASVAFCKTLYLKPGSCDIDGNSLSELMRLAKKKATIFKVNFPVGKSKTISDISTIIHKERHDDHLIESSDALELTRLLIQLGANPNTTDSDGNNALHYATQLAFHDVTQQSVRLICQQLQKLNVSCHIINHQNETPLLYCLSRTIEKVSREEEPWPALKTQAAVCGFLVEHGSSVEAKTGSGETVLHLTVKLLQQGFLKLNSELRKDVSDVALELLEVIVLAFRRQDVSTNTQDNSGNTPLHLWAKLELPPDEEYSSTLTNGYTFQAILKMILYHFKENRTLLEVKKEKGETPLHLCRTWTAVELLLDAGVNPNDVDSSGRPPLLVAAKYTKSLRNPGHFYPDVLQHPKAFWKTAVLGKRLDPWTVDKHGESVMSILIETKSFDLAKGMIEFACEDNTLDSANSIIFSLLIAICKDKSIRAHEKNDLVQIILESGKCSVSGKEGEDSPLHFCCRNIVKNPHEVDDVHWAIAENLLLYEADCNIPDSTGQSSLDIAEGCPKLKELLLKPIDINKVPLLIKWTSISKIHKDKLARVARGRQSKHVEQYWYYQGYLARGSFAAVFAGINEKDGREVAIKRIEKIRMPQPEDKREIRNLTALADCEQVVRYLFFFEDENFSYIVLELMEGNLEDFLNTAAVQMGTKLSICQDIVKGVKFLHDYNIIHRDLKPSNILYKAHPKLCFKIADFGLSRRIDSTGSSISVYGSNVGTRCWIAPEVLTSTKAHSKSSDVFACGLVLHYILSVKTHPFAPRMETLQHETEANMLNGRMKGWDESLCPEAYHLLKAMLDGDGSKRPSADEALNHPLFWQKPKKLDLLVAVGNERVFRCPRAKRILPLTPVETDLEKRFCIIVKYVNWNDKRYVHMPVIYSKMKKKRKYKTNSVVELVRFIRNAHVHVNDLPKPIQKLLQEDFVFLEYFPNLLMEVYKAVTTHGWDQTRQEIQNKMKK